MKNQYHLAAWKAGLVCAAAFTAVSVAADEPVLKKFLAREIVSSDVVMGQVESFCEDRVRRMPEITSLKEWKKYAKQLRRDVLKKVVLQGQAAKWAKAKTKVQWLETLDGEGYCIKKLRYGSLRCCTSRTV